MTDEVVIWNLWKMERIAYRIRKYFKNPYSGECERDWAKYWEIFDRLVSAREVNVDCFDFDDIADSNGPIVLKIHRQGQLFNVKFSALEVERVLLKFPL